MRDRTFHWKDEKRDLFKGYKLHKKFKRKERERDIKILQTITMIWLNFIKFLVVNVHTFFGGGWVGEENKSFDSNNEFAQEHHATNKKSGCTKIEMRCPQQAKRIIYKINNRELLIDINFHRTVITISNNSEKKICFQKKHFHWWSEKLQARYKSPRWQPHNSRMQKATIRINHNRDTNSKQSTA